MMAERKPARFSPKYDIALLKEIVAQNPFAQKNCKVKWLHIVFNMNALLSQTRTDIAFTERGCKDRLKILINAFKKDTLASLKASGTEEEYSERDQLLTKVVELMEEKENVAKETEKKEYAKEEQGVDIRRISMQKLSKKTTGDSDSESKGVSPPINKKKVVQGYVEYLREKDEADRKLKEEELKLKQEQLELEKKREEQRMQRENLMMNLLVKMAEKFN